MERAKTDEPPDDDFNDGQTDRPLPEARIVILLVEDEVQIRKLVAMLLTCEGYVVLLAADGDEALDVSRKFSGKIDLVISDVDMPRKCGDELCGELARERPGLKSLIISSGSSAQAVCRAANLPLLPKPFGRRTLTARVQEVLADRSDSAA
jgi:DNA-binding response OmpR family regulator